jgi:hypothetical protein
MMKLRIFLFAFACLTTSHLAGQAKTRKMPYTINRGSSVNNYAPYISLDGNSLIYISNMAEDDALTMTYTSREGVGWKEPVMVAKPINTRSNFLYGHALSADGKTLYFTASKSDGVGGFDMYSSQLVDGVWKAPQNLGPPINANGHEGCPSFSFDGTMMFFMRCAKMDFESADNCKIMMVKKKAYGGWDAPVELPSIINTGNSQSPRIMADGETLIFSSNKLIPNKGGMDLYQSKLAQGQWTKPVALDFANTAGDDEYVSATSIGRYLLRDLIEKNTSELVEVPFPPEVRPKGVMKVMCTVEGAKDPTMTSFTIFNKKDQSKIVSGKFEKDASFIAYLKEGSAYHLFIDPEQPNSKYVSRTFDLTGDKFKIIERVNANLKPPVAEDEIVLEGISFKPGTAVLDGFSSEELRRLVRLLKANPGRSFSLLVTLEGYEKDSLRSNPDLTEIVSDTTRFPVTYKIDSATRGTRDSLVVKTTYHNDRTSQQARVIAEYLTNSGIPENRLALSGKALPEPVPENRKTRVTLVIH